ncbi:MAG: YgiQ family radical SAM protein, partial [Bacteroidetes bacterium]|nr:YgiQ family radical SAM protein [Bacteroidota bacterium]
MKTSDTYKITDWLPTTLDEVKKRGWDELDVILFSGDAYVDHPSFGHAVVGRIIESEGYRIAIVPQPNWRDDLRDFKKLGKPRLFFGVTGGCMDSMVNHYTANKRLRSNDAYTPDGKAGFRPDYTTITYSKILKDLFPDVPVIIGGVEASLRRLTHYDYWSDQLKPSILLDSKADLLVYGMGEQALKEILDRFSKKIPLDQFTDIPQTAYISKEIPEDERIIELHSHQECLNNKRSFASNFKHIEEESNKVNAKKIVQETKKGFVVVNPPYPVMTEKEIDASFDLPFTRLPHPKYKKRGEIPAYTMIRHSI